jgi:hypothetical protein
LYGRYVRHRKHKIDCSSGSRIITVAGVGRVEHDSLDVLIDGDVHNGGSFLKLGIGGGIAWNEDDAVADGGGEVGGGGYYSITW